MSHQPVIHPVLCCHTVAEIRSEVGRWHGAGQSVALVPTMGALHEGHLSLVRQAKREADRVVVSIFVNPTQFAPHEDFSTYPRQLIRDLDLLATVGIDAVFCPEPAVMYPPGFSTSISLKGPAAAGLEDASRPVFFNGVATVVAKLLIQIGPDCAIFGEKDFQQLAVIRQLAADLDLPVRILGGPTMREGDGLAMSSRNVYLDAQERALAPSLYQAMQDVAHGLSSGQAPDAVLQRAVGQLTAKGFKVDYLALRDALTLAERPADQGEQAEGRLLVAAWLGKTRLIDNIAIPAIRPQPHKG